MTAIRLTAILTAFALLMVLAPRVLAALQLQRLRVRALSLPAPRYLRRNIDHLLAFHRATFGSAAMALELWDILQPSDLTRFSRDVPQPQEFTGLDLVLPDRSVNSFKARIRTLTRTLRAAKFRRYNSENYVAGRPTTLVITDLLLPPVGQKIPLTEMELLEQAFAAGDRVSDDVIQQIYDDAETNVRATRARVHLAKGDVLTDGKFSLVDENGLTLDADFELAGSHKPTASTLWSDHDDSTPMDDEEAWIQQMVSDGSPRPTLALASLTIVNHLRANAQYRQARWGGVTTSQPNLSMDELNTVRQAYGLPRLVVEDSVVDVDGTTTRAIPVNKFIMVAEGAGETQYGVTAQALQAASGGTDAAFTRRDAPGIFTAAYKELEPPARWTSTSANAMPLLVDATRLVSATVA